MEVRTKLRKVKERVETLLEEGEYTKVVEEIEALSQGYTPRERDLEWAELMVRFAFAQEQLGRYNIETAEAAYEVLKMTDRRREVGTVEWILGKMLLGLGETKSALRYLRNSFSEFDRMEDEKRKAQVLNTLGQGYFLSGCLKEAVKYLTESLDLCKREAKDNQRLKAMTSSNLGTCHILTGKWPLASKLLRSSLMFYESLNDTLRICRRLCGLCRLYILQRRWERFSEISELLERAQKLADEGGYQRERATVWESRGWLEIGLYQRDGDSHHLELAEEALLKALQIGYQIASEGDVVMEASEKLGWVCFLRGNMRGNLDAAFSYGERSLRLARHLGSAYDEALAHRLLGAVYQARAETKADRRKAREHFARSISLLEEVEAQYDLAVSLLYSGKVLVEDGGTRSEGFGQILQARKIFEALKLSCWLGRSWIEEARGKVRERDFDQASQCLTTAREVLKGSGEEEALREIVQVRTELDEASTQASLKVKEEINLLDELNQPSNSFDRLVKALMKKTSADRAFVGVRGSADGFELRAYRGIDEGNARALLEKVGSLDGDLLKPRIPIFSSSVSDDPRLTPVKEEKVTSLMLVPLGMDNELDGLLYVDRLSGKPFQQRERDFFVLSAGILQLKVTELQREELIKEVKSLRERVGEGELIITRNKEMRKVLDSIHSLKDISPSVLIEGESGTGKELIARLIYRNSPRKDKPFIPINCASIPDNLLESELFGYEKGAFTDAKALHRGIFEVANGGTVFLDEIGDLSLALQPKLLRFLETQAFRRVGGTEEIRVDVRIIVASNKDLRQEVETSRFREDLFYRLNHIPIRLPSLRERKEDVLPLLQHYLEYYNREYNREVEGISPDALSLLLAYSWPGNIRELMTVVENGVIMARGSLITPELLPEEIRGQKPRFSEEMWNLRELPQGNSSQEVLENLKRQMTERALKRCKGNRTRAASLLGITREGLVRRLKRYQSMGK